MKTLNFIHLFCKVNGTLKKMFFHWKCLGLILYNFQIVYFLPLAQNSIYIVKKAESKIIVLYWQSVFVVQNWVALANTLVDGMSMSIIVITLKYDLPNISIKRIFLGFHRNQIVDSDDYYIYYYLSLAHTCRIFCYFTNEETWDDCHTCQFRIVAARFD